MPSDRPANDGLLRPSTSPDPPSVPTLVYDGDCGFCRRWVDRFKRWERDDVVALLPLQSATASRITGKTPEVLEQAMHLVLPDGSVFPGAAAARELTRYVGGGTIARAVLGLPGAMPLLNRVYRWVARRRYRLGCGGDHCSVTVASSRDQD